MTYSGRHARRRRLQVDPGGVVHLVAPLEFDELVQAKAYLEQIGATVTVLGGGRRRLEKWQTPGVADMVVDHVAWNLRDVWIEMKQVDGQLRPAQRKWIEAKRAAGGTVLVAKGAVDAVRQFVELPRHP